MVNMCRVCMSQDRSLTDIFSSAIGYPHLHITVMECAPVQIFPGDALPQFICSECINNLDTAYRFRDLCTQTDTLLRQNTYDKFTVKTEELKEEFDIPVDLEATNVDELKQFYDENDGFIDDENLNNTYGTDDESKSQSTETEQKTKASKRIQRGYKRYNYSEIKIRTDGRFQCDLCDNHYKSKYHLKRHKQEHTQPTIVVCEVCGKSFSRSDKLVAHKRIHIGGVKSKKCQHCDKMLYDTTSLRRHIARMHSPGPKTNRFDYSVIKVREDGRFQCDLCENHYKMKRHLMRHRVTHLWNNPLCVCDVCGKGFKRKEHFKVHQKVHKEERNHVCEYCEKAFYSKTDLKRHTGIHLGVKPFKCEFCPNAFAQKKTLQNHIRTHTGERPFACEICAKRFNRRHHLKTHMLVHTGEKKIK